MLHRKSILAQRVIEQECYQNNYAIIIHFEFSR